MELKIDHLPKEEQEKVLKRISEKKAKFDEINKEKAERKAKVAEAREKAIEDKVKYTIINAKDRTLMYGWIPPKPGIIRKNNKDIIEIPFAMAICSPLDRFSIKVGKQIINNRLYVDKDKISFIKVKANRLVGNVIEIIDILAEVKIINGLITGESGYPNNTRRK